MLKKIFGYAILLLVAYTASTYVWKPTIDEGQATWQDNLLKAEEFLYTDDVLAYENILVGSSMTCRLIDDSLPGFYNLGFMGGNYFFGMELLLERSIYPKRLFIETNFTGANNGRLERVFEQLDHPLFKPARRFIPSMQESYAPFLRMGNSIEQALFEQYLPYADRSKFDGLFQSVVEINVEGNLAFALPEAELVQNMVVLRNILIEFEKNGTSLYFYEMPLSSKFYDAPNVKSKRVAFEREFADDKYTMLPYPVRGEYVLEDDLHLNGTERYKFTAQMKHWTDSLFALEKVKENSMEIPKFDSSDN